MLIRENHFVKAKKPGKTTFVQRGNGLELPLIGHLVSEVRLRSHALPILIFRDLHNKESQIEFAAVIVELEQGEVSHSFIWNSKPSDLNANPLPFVALLGTAVTGAVANKNGLLHLEFSNGYSLKALPDIYEGWHFQGSGLFLHGDDGRLI